MRRGMSNPCGFKVRCYAASLVDFNYYLAVLPGEKIGDKICVTEINEIFINSTPKSCSKQAYAQGFNFEPINFKAADNIFELTEIAEYIYEGVV